LIELQPGKISICSLVWTFVRVVRGSATGAPLAPCLHHQHPRLALTLTEIVSIRKSVSPQPHRSSSSFQIQATRPHFSSTRPLQPARSRHRVSLWLGCNHLFRGVRLVIFLLPIPLFSPTSIFPTPCILRPPALPVTLYTRLPLEVE